MPAAGKQQLTVAAFSGLHRDNWIPIKPVVAHSISLWLRI